MKNLIFVVLGLWSYMLPAQGLITAAEYFIDQDPGQGSGIGIPVASANEVSTSLQVPTTALDNGLHTIGVRVRSNAGRWSTYSRKYFWVYTWSSTTVVIAAEYFFGWDPGAGNGTAIAITSGTTTSGSINIPIPGLEPGLHTLYLRFQNNSGDWSVYSRSNFYILPTGSPNQLVAAEYYFDEEPGFGAGTALDISAGSSVSASFVIPLPDEMEPGLHMMLMRTLDAKGLWSVPQRHLFYYHPSDPALDIVLAEFFIDEDPGIGAATPLIVEPSGTLSEVYNIQTPANLSEGDHMLFMRVQRSDGAWSIYAAHAFTIDFTAGTAERMQAFSMYPNPTPDMLFLEAEGVTISSIRVYDMQGKLVVQEVFNGHPLHLGRFGKGTYLLQLQFTDGSAVSKRVVVQ